MTQEEKQLLLQDLCARLPYGVKCYVPFENCTMELTGKRLNYFCFHKDAWGIDYSHEQEVVIDPLNDADNNYIVKPYLRPMSSMTEEEVAEYKAFHCVAYEHTYFYPQFCTVKNELNMFDWLNAHHFDFRNLIERGLAIDCTGLNIY